MLVLQTSYISKGVAIMGERKIAIYSRKSKFTGKGESIENQIELCKTYIKNKNPDIKDEDILVYEDEGYSGKNTNRPQFQLMMKAAKDKKLSGIVCYRLDRISRNVGDFSILIDELNDYNMTFDSINEKFDTSTPMGKAMMYICSIFAQLERETIAERIRDNMHELAKTGRWLGGHKPTGYESQKIVERIDANGKKIESFKLEIIPHEAELVKLIFSKFIEFNSLTKIETYFLQNNIKTKNGKTFTRFTIKAILQNPVYMIADKTAWKYFEDLGVEIYAEKEKFDSVHGLLGYNKTLQRTGKSNVMRSIDEWIITVGKHIGIISGEDWVKVQRLLEQNTSKSYRKSKSNTALLSGLLICGNCGGFMRPKMYNQDYEVGERRFSYLCETKEKSRQHNCRIKNPNGNILDRAVCEEIKKLSEDSGEFIKQLESVKERIKSNSDEYDMQIESLQSGIADRKRQVDNLVNSLANSTGEVAYEYINQRIDELDKEIKESQQRLIDLKKLTEQNVLSDSEFDILRDILKSYASSFDTMNIEQKRAAIRTFVKRIVWDGENIHMYLYGSEEEESFGEPSRGDRKRNSHVNPPRQKVCKPGFSERADRF